MGGMLYEGLSEVVELDRKSFIYGNIEPDCALATLLPPHMMTNYLEWVLTLTDCLIEKDLTRNVLSEGLGILCHFLSDFCCLYHAKEEKFHNLIGHVIYEKRLHNHHKKKESSFLKRFFFQVGAGSRFQADHHKFPGRIFFSTSLLGLRFILCLQALQSDLSISGLLPVRQYNL